MARRHHQLLAFLQSGLIENKYRNLIFEDNSRLIFSINLPRRTRMLSAEHEQMLKDWYEMRNREYIYGSRHYTEARHVIAASLRKSDDVEILSFCRGKFTCRMLSEEESRERRRLRRENRDRLTRNTDDALPLVESGYVPPMEVVDWV